jgi:hypothetical protein
MRDINRIDPIVEKIGKFWKTRPDYRFWQIINVLHDELVKVESNRDIFFTEDDKWEEALDNLLKNEKS